MQPSSFLATLRYDPEYERNTAGLHQQRTTGKAEERWDKSELVSSRLSDSSPGLCPGSTDTIHFLHAGYWEKRVFGRPGFYDGYSLLSKTVMV